MNLLLLENNWKIYVTSIIIFYLIYYYCDDKLKYMFPNNINRYISIGIISYIASILIKNILNIKEKFMYNDELGYKCTQAGLCYPTLTKGEFPNSSIYTENTYPDYYSCKNKCNPRNKLCQNKFFKDLPINNNLIENYKQNTSLPFYINGKNYNCKKVNFINSKSFKLCMTGPTKNMTKEECDIKCTLK